MCFLLGKQGKFEVEKRISFFQTYGYNKKMSATKFLTEQTQCPRHNCPQGYKPYDWYNYSYCFPQGSKLPWDREHYWAKVNRPAGLHLNCPHCWEFDNYIDDQWQLARTHCKEIEERREKKAKAKNGKHKGAWSLCFNYSPSWYENDYEAQEAIRLAVNRLLKYYKEDIEVFRAVGEYTKAGRSHVHIYYKLDSGGKITDKNLKRAYPNWNAKVKVGNGVQGGQHAPVINIADYTGYIEKDLDVSWLLVEYPNAIHEKVNLSSSDLPQEEINVPAFTPSSTEGDDTSSEEGNSSSR